MFPAVRPLAATRCALVITRVREHAAERVLVRDRPAPVTCRLPDFGVVVRGGIKLNSGFAAKVEMQFDASSNEPATPERPLPAHRPTHPRR